MIGSPWQIFGRGCLVGLVLTACLAPAAPAQLEVTFRLVPEEDWDDARADRSDTLPSGEIYLYREGSYVPELVAEANEPQVVTPGRWLWIAEGRNEAGDEYVSVVSGKIHYPEGAELFNKGLLGPVAPACRVELAETTWEGVERLDAVSLDRQAVYPVIVEDRRSVLVPEGRFVAYAVGSEGVVGISDVRSCEAGEVVPLSRPEPPGAGKQDLMVSVQLPEPVPDLRDHLNVALRPFGESSPLGPTEPDAALWTQQRVTYFFLDVSARMPLVLEVRHPDFFPRSREISPRPESVRELPDVELEPRTAP